jgi:hypothetical protein
MPKPPAAESRSFLKRNWKIFFWVRILFKQGQDEILDLGDKDRRDDGDNAVSKTQYHLLPGFNFQSDVHETFVIFDFAMAQSTTYNL